MLGVQRRHKDLVEHEKNNNNYHVLPQQQLKSWLTGELETANNHFWEINEGVKKCTKECLENWTKTDVENASGIATLLEAIKTTQNNAERGKNSRIDPDAVSSAEATATTCAVLGTPFTIFKFERQMGNNAITIIIVFNVDGQRVIIVNTVD